MDLFSDFCNICYNTDDGNLMDISEVNMKHLKDSLITLVGHADIIKHNGIYLCQLCCKQLTHFEKFREMCFSRLIHFRQMYFNMKSKLDLEDGAAAAENTLVKFVHEDVLRLGKMMCTVSNSTECLEIIKSSPEFNKNESVLNGQVINLQSERNKCKFDSDYSEESVINIVAKCDESRSAFRNEEMKNKVTNVVKFERESDEDFTAPDINNVNENNTSQIQFLKERIDLKNEILDRDSEDFKLNNFQNESELVELLEEPVVNNSEASISSRIEYTEEEIHVKEENITAEDSGLETIENAATSDHEGVVFEFVNVCPTEYKQDCRNGEYTKVEMKVQRRRNNKSTTAIINSQPHVREQHKGGFPAALQSDGILEYPGVESNTCTACDKPFETCTCLIIHNSDRLYKCTVCNKTLPSLSHLTIHERTHSGARPYQCSVCNKAFAQSSNLTSHERIHRGDKPYKCTVCNKAFTQSSCLTIHERTHSNDRPYNCAVCTKTFTCSANLTTHERTHSGDRPYKCTICNKSFTNSSCLTVHKRTHSNDRPYKCTICSKSFTCSSNLTTHVRRHSGERPYKCSICNKAFTVSSALAKHERTHSGAKPYKCDVCNKSYTQSCDLTRHERTHSGDRPYKCTVCHKTFMYSFSLTKHKRTHSGDKPYQCTVCNKSFTCSSNLVIHERKHNGDRPYICTICNKSFTQSFDLSRHERIHSGDRPYKCSICNKTFTQLSTMTRHERTHSGDRPHKCLICSKSFTYAFDLTRHVRIHSGDRP